MHLLPLPHATPLPSPPLPSPPLPCMCLCVCVVVWLLVSTVSSSYIMSFLLHRVARPSGTAMPSALLPKPRLHVPPRTSDLSIHKGMEKSPFTAFLTAKECNGYKLAARQSDTAMCLPVSHSSTQQVLAQQVLTQQVLTQQVLSQQDTRQCFTVPVRSILSPAHLECNSQTTYVLYVRMYVALVLQQGCLFTDKCLLCTRPPACKPCSLSLSN